ncbi:MAG: hypothetical protein V2B18_09290 [Pseudomonadota bacterium]
MTTGHSRKSERAPAARGLFRGWLLLIIPLLCASCITAGVPKKADPAPAGGSGEASTAASASLSGSRIVDTWELMFRVNEKGEEERPRGTSRTLVEFTDKGRVIFNRSDREESAGIKSKTGKYDLGEKEIKVTDEEGHTDQWPYRLSGDTLVIYMPQSKKEFHLRRFK